MKIKEYAMATLLVLFAGKYIQLAMFATNSKMLGYAGDVLLLVALAMIAFISLKFLDGNYRAGNIAVAAGAAAFLLLHMIFWLGYLYLVYQIIMVIALFVMLYPLHQYETKKYAAFGSAFLMIYVLTESISMLRSQFNLPIFAFYLTLSLSMFIPGILKMKN